MPSDREGKDQFRKVGKANSIACASWIPTCHDQIIGHKAVLAAVAATQVLRLLFSVKSLACIGVVKAVLEYESLELSPQPLVVEGWLLCLVRSTLSQVIFKGGGQKSPCRACSR